MSICQELRTVGQGLESLEVGDFNLQREGLGYFALAVRQAPLKSERAAVFGKEVALKLVQNTWQRFTRENSSDRKLSEPGADVLRILFTPEGLLKLEAAGIAKRNRYAPGVPDPRKLGQILRMVGEAIDSKSGRLLSVRKRRQQISFEYSTRAEDHAEEWQISELYELWLDTSKQRLDRANIVERQLQGERQQI